MDDPTEILYDDAQTTVYLRNAFYKQKYHAALGVCILNFVVIAILCGMLIYLIQHPPRPLYFAADHLSRLIEEVPVTTPNMSTQDVANWTVSAVQSAYSYDFVNYRAELQHAERYFTPYGWKNYLKGLSSSNNLIAVKDRNMVVIAKAVSAPKLIVEGILGGAYAWKFEIPLLITYMLPPYDSKSQFQNPLLVNVIVQRQRVLESASGLGIVQMIGNLVLTPSAQNVNAQSS
jgi:intracellular multiplication protein IcmL